MEWVIAALGAWVTGLTLCIVSLRAHLAFVYSNLKIQRQLNAELCETIKIHNDALAASVYLPALVVRAMVEPVCLKQEITDEALQTLLNGEILRPENGSPPT